MEGLDPRRETLIVSNHYVSKMSEDRSLISGESGADHRTFRRLKRAPITGATSPRRSGRGLPRQRSPFVSTAGRAISPQSSIATPRLPS